MAKRLGTGGEQFSVFRRSRVNPRQRCSLIAALCARENVDYSPPSLPCTPRYSLPLHRLTNYVCTGEDGLFCFLGRTSFRKRGFLGHLRMLAGRDSWVPQEYSHPGIGISPDNEISPFERFVEQVTTSPSVFCTRAFPLLARRFSPRSKPWSAGR